jgi:hypothetical protein
MFKRMTLALILCVTLSGGGLALDVRSHLGEIGVAATTTGDPQTSFHLFFLHITSLIDRAASYDRTGKAGGNGFRKRYQRTLGLSDNEHDVLLRRAVSCEDEVRRHDADAQKIIEALWKRIPEGKTPADLPVPGEIAELQAQRKAILSEHINRLEREIGPGAFKKINGFVLGEFSRSITRKAFAPDARARVATRSVTKND